MSSLIERIGEACEGKEVWRVRDKDDGSFCIQFEAWEESEARHWWNNHSQRDICKNRELVKMRIFSQKDRLLQECAKMLHFFFGQMQMHSPKMNGQHSYTFRSSGWPMTHCKGPNAEQAILSAMAEIKRSQDESSLPKLSDLVGLYKDNPVDVGGGFIEIPTNGLTTNFRKASDEEAEGKSKE
jgi:hypothetical protein